MWGARCAIATNEIAVPRVLWETLHKDAENMRVWIWLLAVAMLATSGEATQRRWHSTERWQVLDGEWLDAASAAYITNLGGTARAVVFCSATGYRAVGLMLDQLPREGRVSGSAQVDSGPARPVSWACVRWGGENICTIRSNPRAVVVDMIRGNEVLFRVGPLRRRFGLAGSARAIRRMVQLESRTGRRCD